MGKKKYYPSQKRYLEKNPVVSFRLKTEEKRKIEEIAEMDSMTVGDYVRNFLRGIVQERKKDIELYDKGFNDGFHEGHGWGVRESQIWFYCDVCGEPIDVEPDSNSHKAIIEYMKEHGWGHARCVNVG